MKKTIISAEIIADSKNEHGQRLTTFIVKFPRMILAEFNTHRMLSKNSASSRAIPFRKMMDMVLQDPFIPLKWMKDHPGMQGVEYFDEVASAKLERIWIQSSIEAVSRAQELHIAGLSKQICNRPLETYMWHTAIVTGSEWENFFALRAHGAAEIHMQELAERMLEVYNVSEPQKLKAGEWHIPFGDKFDKTRLADLIRNGFAADGEEAAWKIATARCARLSYLNFEGKDDYEADIKLHDNLLASGHMSPFEHCAKAMSADDFFVLNTTSNKGELSVPAQEELSKYDGWSGNFKGFIQYRKTLIGENKSDNRVVKK